MKARGRAGFSLVEILIACTIFVLVAGAIANTVVVANALNDTNRETVQATMAAESALELLKGTTFEEVFARYNALEADNPALGESPGIGFAAAGLKAQEGDADGLAGRIEFPGDGTELREDVLDRELGMPRDLDRDGETDDEDHAGDYGILPVRVIVEWAGSGGNRNVELVSTLTDR